MTRTDGDPLLLAADPTVLQGHILRAQSLLGASFEILERSFTRGRQRKVPSSKLHPLMILVAAAHESITGLKGGPFFHGFQVVISSQALSELEEWRDHPLGPTSSRRLRILERLTITSWHLQQQTRSNASETRSVSSHRQGTDAPISGSLLHHRTR